MLPPPGFHHLHLNSADPEAAIDFYVRQFPSTAKTMWAGLPALASPNNVLILFSRVDRPPPTSPQTAIWHFGWHVKDVRANRKDYLARGIELLPLYTGDEDGSVLISTDTWPGRDGVLGLTKAQLVEAKAARVELITVGVNASGDVADAALALCGRDIDVLFQISDNLTGASFASTSVSKFKSFRTSPAVPHEGGIPKTTSYAR